MILSNKQHGDDTENAASIPPIYDIISSEVYFKGFNGHGKSSTVCQTQHRPQVVHHQHYSTVHSLYVSYFRQPLYQQPQYCSIQQQTTCDA